MLKSLWGYIRPQSVQGNERIRRRFAIAYAFFGWNTVLYVIYMTYRDKLPSDPVERCKMLSVGSTDRPYERIQIQNFTIKRYIKSEQTESTLDLEDKQNIKTA